MTFDLTFMFAEIYGNKDENGRYHDRHTISLNFHLFPNKEENSLKNSDELFQNIETKIETIFQLEINDKYELLKNVDHNNCEEFDYKKTVKSNNFFTRNQNIRNDSNMSEERTNTKWEKHKIEFPIEGNENYHDTNNTNDNFSSKIYKTHNRYLSYSSPRNTNESWRKNKNNISNLQNIQNTKPEIKPRN